jgi:hypothetical protein
VELTPPTGCERLFAVWTRQPVVLDPEQLRQVAGEASVASTEYRATRDLVRLKRQVGELPPGEWHVAVLEVDHAD